MRALKIGLAVVLGLTMAATAVAAPPPDDAWMAQIEGGWAGDHNDTPLGEMPFLMLFDRQEDGSLHCKTAMNRETFVELRFFKDEASGRWLLDERAGLEGLGVQEYTLEPVEVPGEVRRWHYPAKPGYLTVDVKVDDDRMWMDVQIHEKPHATFEMTRIPQDKLAAIREELRQNAERPVEGASIYEALAAAPPAAASDPIEEARQAVAAEPDSTDRRMELVALIAETMQRDPSQAPMLAFEMLRTLNEVVAMDEYRADAYHYLVGYHLNAPPIAGGSVDKAEAYAKKLASFDPEGGKQLMATVAARR